MPDIRYGRWSFVPVDDDPPTCEPTSFNPPIITTMAVDLHSSLIFQFASAISPLHIAVECTALSAEQHSDTLFEILTGSQSDRYQPLNHAGWELHYDGMHGIFSTQIERAEHYLKLHYTQQRNLIVAKVGFSQP